MPPSTPRTAFPVRNAALTRNVSLTVELDGFIASCLQSGDFNNASEVVRAGLKLLRDGYRGSDSGASGAAKVSWPIGGGECGRLIRERDWSHTPLGPIESWSESLRSTVTTLVASPVPKLLAWGPEHVVLYNDAYRLLLGDRHPLALGGGLPEIDPASWDRDRAAIQCALGGEVAATKAQALSPQRNGIVFDLYHVPVHETDGRVGGVLRTVVENAGRSVTNRNRADSDAQLRSIADALPVLIAQVDPEHRYQFNNQAYLDWFGMAPAEIRGRHLREIIGEIAYEERRPAIDRALAGEEMSFDSTIPHRDGRPRRCETRYIPRRDADGVVDGIYLMVIDIEERLDREAVLAASSRRFRAAIDAVHGVLWTNSADGRMIGPQPGWEALTGQTPDQYQGFGWAEAVHPEDVGPSILSWNAAVAAKKPYVHEHRVRSRDGHWRTFAIRALPILDDDGTLTEWVGVHTDITHRRAAEQSLREQAETLSRQVRHRERAEEQLRQLNEQLEARVVAEIDERRRAELKLARAQKLETVGKLTGGIAHDFNNLLQVISGNLHLLSKHVAGDARAEQRLANAEAGVARGARLAAQLLAFGRRQALEPKVVNPARLLGSMDDMLRRAVGEAVAVETVIGGGQWNCLVDPGQLENAILNLAINARDAMDRHGKLTVELANAHLDDRYANEHDEVTPGQYVMLAVTDTGCGMTPEVQAKVFEPFFSTKAEGKGSGLGLSMVYGFTKQSGGHVKIYSEPGHGTTIRLYLPRAIAGEDALVAPASGPVVGGSETVLVVEDDEAVRTTVVALLSELGYRVLKAVDASNALAVVESGIPIDLLFTDVVMPGPLKSPEMARRAKERLPHLAVLFTSGYTENSIVHGGRLDAGVELLSKPYGREALARKVRHVLSNEAQRRLAAERDAVLPGPARTPDADTVLLVEDDPLIRAVSAEMLRGGGLSVIEAGDAERAAELLAEHPVSVLVTDINLPGLSGPELAGRARQLRPGIGVVFASGEAAPLLRGELSDSISLPKPYDAAALLGAVRTAMARTAAGTAPFPVAAPR